jgi:preprotein translocase subunit SecY
VEPLLAVGSGVGLSSVAGVRAYLPLALVGIFDRLGLFELPEPFDFLTNWLVIVALLALAVVESGLDKIPALDTLLDVVQTPFRIVAGALLFSAALEAGLGVEAIPGLAAGGGIAGTVAVLKAVLRPPANVASAGVSAPFLSTFEDVVAVVGGILAVLVPLVSLLLVAFLLFFFYRVRRRRGRKYGGLRILGD